MKIKERLEEKDMTPWKLLTMVLGPEYVLNNSLLLLLPLLFSLPSPTLLLFLLLTDSVTD